MSLLINDAQLKKANNKLGKKKKKQSPKFFKIQKSCPRKKNHIQLNLRKKKKKKSKMPYCIDQTKNTKKEKKSERVRSYITPRRKKNNKETIGT